MKKVVLAYSGGLDTSVAVAWLKEQYGAEVVTLTVDLGGGSIKAGVEGRAMSAGASKAYVVDARETFVSQYVWRALQANAIYQGAYPLATALARPLLAQLLVEVAQREGADAVAHGCTGKGNDQVRFDVAVHALDPGLEVVAPMRVGMGLTRDQSIDYANARGIEIPITKSSPYSIDVNLWGRSCETGILEDPWVTPPDDAYAWTVAPKDAPDAVDIVIGFEGGIPVSIDGEALSGVELVERLHELGGAHGVGRIDHVEDRLVGIKSREIYEAPAAVILHTAHHALEGLVLSKEQLRFNRLVADELAQIIYDGLWFSALSRDLRTYALSSQRVVSGEVRIGAPRCRCTTGTWPRTTRATPSTTRPPWASSRSSGCRSAWRRRATGQWASTTARHGPGRTRCSRTCRRASPGARPPRADAPRPGAPARGPGLGARRPQRARRITHARPLDAVGSGRERRRPGPRRRHAARGPAGCGTATPRGRQTGPRRPPRADRPTRLPARVRPAGDARP
jgi:argininosuccinate synthase